MHEMQRGITSTGHNTSRGNQNFTNKIDMRYTPIDSRSGLSGNMLEIWYLLHEAYLQGISADKPTEYCGYTYK